MTGADADRSFRLVEECRGVGEICWRDRVLGGVGYTVRRFQGFAPSGLPVPGAHRLEGELRFGEDADPAELVHAVFTLRLEDGRSMRLTLVDEGGRVLAEGHGPAQCGCC